MTNVTLITTQTTDPLENKGVSAVHAYLQAQIASKVRQARSNAHMSRRILAEKSGVSQRYLAQLESAEGNISIALLLRVAMALDLQLEWLLKDAEPLDQELTKLLALYKKADPTLRARIMEQLEDRQNAYERAKRICLVGLRGAGKSTLGALAADCLSVPFL